MKTGTLGLGIGIGLTIGIALGLAIAILAKGNTSVANPEGVTYTYDGQDRLQSILPMNNNTHFVNLKAVD